MDQEARFELCPPCRAGVKLGRSMCDPCRDRFRRFHRLGKYDRGWHPFTPSKQAIAAALQFTRRLLADKARP